MSLRAVGKKIVILQKSAEQTTQSGLVIPDSAQEKPQEGTIFAISAEAAEETGLSVDDTVIFSKYGSTHVTVLGQNFVICEAKDILVVVAE